MMNTKQAKIAALSIADALIAQYLSALDRADDETEVTDELKRLANRLSQQRDKLINPPAPRPRNPKAALTVDTASEPKAHYEPSGEYVNVNAKRERSKR